MLEALRSNIGTIVERWAAASARATFMRGSDFQTPDQEREDRLRIFLVALLKRAQDPGDKMALESLKTAIRSEHSRSLSLSTLVRRQSLLRDIMYEVLVKELPSIPKTTVKLAVDAIVDRSIEGTVVMLEEYSELQSTLSRWMLSAALDEVAVDQSLARFCTNMMDYFDAEFVALFKIDHELNKLAVQACSAKGISLAKDASVQMKVFPLVADAIAQKKTVVSSDDKPKSKKGKVVGQVLFNYCLAVPMLRDDKVVGVLFMGDNQRPGIYTPDEMVLAEDLVNQLRRMLDNTDLFERLSMRSKAQKILIDTAAELQTEIESEEIYRIVGTRLAEIIPSDEFAFYVYDWSRRVGNPVYATGPYAAETMADRDFSADIGIAGYVARTRKAEIIVDTESDPRGETIPGTPAMHTRMLAVPVVGQKEVIGVIELIRYPPSTFGQEDLETAILFANHASVALENAKLLKEVMSVRDQLELSIDLLTHDIANYTTPITAYFSELKDRSNLDPEIAAVVDKTATQIESIMRLVEMVRTTTKLREGGRPKLRPTDLRKAVDEAVAEVRKQVSTQGVEFEMYFPATQASVLADDMLKELFTNLFFSAAMSDKGRDTKLILTVDTKKDNKVEYWWVKVAQPSKSIPDNLKDEVLRLTKISKSELGGGFGIGLAAAKGIVNRYSGGMWVSDISPGEFTKGCVFNICLPKAR
jgi:GAF domain-containing protein